MTKTTFYIVKSIFFTILIASIDCSAQSLQRYAYTKGLMGSEFNIVFYATNDSVAQAAADSVWGRVAQLNGLLSDYLDNSEINQLSATSGSGREVKVSSELFDILHKSVVISKKTKGAFDVSIGSVVQVWRRAIRRKYFPEKSEITEAKQKMGYRNIVLSISNQSVILVKKGMKLDVGAIGKGYAADEGLKVLKHFGITSGLIDAGGDLAIGQAPPNSNGWKIDVSSGIDTTQKQTLLLSNCGVATSGIAYRFLEHRGKRYSHIVNPRTGVGLLRHIRTTVVAQNGTEADALATAFSVLGIVGTKKVAKRFSNLKVWLLEENQEWKWGQWE
jgi:FAD:protein FMN transferase